MLNLAPAADDDSYGTGADTALTVPAGTGLLDRDTDANGDSLAAVLDKNVPVGTLVLHGDGSFVYTPAPDSGETLSIYAVGDSPRGTVGNQGAHLLYTLDAGFHGTDVFTYTISDGNGGYDTATVTVTVQEATWGVYLPLVLRNVVAGGDR